MTGVTPRNDEELAQSEVECREGKHHSHDVRVLCPWNMHLHLAVQTCVRQRKPRLLGMAAFDGVCRLEVRGTIGYDIASLDLPSGTRPNSTVVGVYRGKTVGNLWLIRGYHRVLAPSILHLDKNTVPNVQHNCPVCALFSPLLDLLTYFFSYPLSNFTFRSVSESHFNLIVFFCVPASVTHLTYSCDPQYQRGAT